MTKKARKSAKKQDEKTEDTQSSIQPISSKSAIISEAIEKISTRAGLFQWVVGCGLEALGEAMRIEAEAIAGAKSKHCDNRTHNHWGHTTTEFPFGGQKMSMPRPRVRRVGGGEVQLETVREFQDSDALPERVQEQILVGVSTRGYKRSLGEGPEDLELRGASKSAASRNLVKRTTQKMNKYLSRSLANLELTALMIDGIHIAERSIVVCLGITAIGQKVPLGIWMGSTENAELCTTLLNDLLDRGMKVEGKLLCVIDGGRGIRKSLQAVFGDRALIQRCQLHKQRNIRGHLPKAKQNYVDKQMSRAYGSPSYKSAKAKLLSLVKWLMKNGEDDAARSLKEGLEETLTLLKLGIKGNLLRSLTTTNAIENLMGTIRRVTRNVKRWQGGSMIRRWIAMAIEEAESKFHRIKGYRQLNELKNALSRLDELEKAA